MTPAVLLACLAVAAPVPGESPSDWHKRAFGTFEDPDKDCEFAPDPATRTLVVRVPAAKRGWPTDPTTAPRTAREVTGDFTAEVGVSYEPPPFLPKDSTSGTFGGGLWVRPGDGRNVLWCRHHLPGARPGAAWYWNDHVTVRMVDRDHAAPGTAAETAATPLYLRVERSGNRLAFSSSADRKSWAVLTRDSFALPAAVTVGVYAVQNTGAPVAVTFRDFTVAAGR